MTTASSAFKSPFGTISPDMFQNMFQAPEGLGTMARTAMEASTASTRASVKGMQDVGGALMAQMKEQMALSVETGKQLSDVKTIEDAMGLQASYMKSAMEANMKGFAQLSELYATSMRETFAPIAKQMQKATDA